MRQKNNLQKFSSACEHLLADITMQGPLTHDEVLLVKHYCNEVLSKVDQPPENPAQVLIPGFHKSAKNR